MTEQPGFQHFVQNEKKNGENRTRRGSLFVVTRIYWRDMGRMKREKIGKLQIMKIPKGTNKYQEQRLINRVCHRAFHKRWIDHIHQGTMS